MCDPPFFTPPHLPTFFSSDRHDYGTRNAHKLSVIQSSSTKYGVNSILPVGIKLLNSLPVNLYQGLIKTFNNRLRVHFLNIFRERTLDIFR